MKIYNTHERLLADTLTPVAIYLRLRDHFPNSLLLESSDYHSKADSLSFICLQAMAGFEATGKNFEYHFPNEKPVSGTSESLNAIMPKFESFINAFEVEKAELPFDTAGLFGYSSFESIQYFEEIELKVKPSENKANPDLKYQLFRYVIVIDHFKNELYIVKHDTGPLEQDDKDIARLKSFLQVNHSAQFSFKTVGEESCKNSPEEFKSMVTKGIAHCQRGDVFQVVLSREFNQGFKGDDFNVY
ncbi:MAG TPA: hypothetical protein VJ949_06845, partial [Cryomorphaceae bacterium]|nr:hypothetical protein [Cryomorphaceae bacterium]